MVDLKQPRKLYITSFILLFLAGFFFAWTLFFSGEGAYGGALRKERFSFFLLGEEGEVLLSRDESLPLTAGKRSLRLKNGEDREISFILYQEGEEMARGEVSPREEIRFEIESGSAPLSILLKREEKEVAYLSDEASFHSAAEEMPQGGDLVFLSPVRLGKIFLSAPFRLFGAFSFEEMSLRTDLAGKVVLYPDEAFCANLYVSSPRCALHCRNFTPGFAKEERNFFIKAKSFNGEYLSPASYPVSSFGQLERLSDQKLLPDLTEGANIVFTKPFNVEGSLCFNQIVSLTFSAPISFCGNRLSFFSEKEGTFRVKSAPGATVDCALLEFSAPFADLVWESEGGAVPALSTVNKIDNVKSYNGDALSLGGAGKGIPSLSLSAEKNDFLEEDVSFTQKGNLLCADLPYLVDKIALQDAVFTLSCQGGEATLSGSLPDGVIVTRDEQGRERRFAVAVEREGLGIPVVYLETMDGAEISSKTQYVSATFRMDGENSAYETQNEVPIRIRGRGNSTWKWEKKPYKIHFEEKTSLLGLPAAEEWALFANYADKSLMRNHLAQKMAEVLSFEYCPTQAYVDVFLNGAYLGVYTLGEHLETGEGRVEIDYDMNKNDCGFFLEVGGVVSGVDVKGMNYFHAGLLKFVLIKSPEYTTLTSQQFSYIKDYLVRANDAVKSGVGYDEYLDMDTLVDWMIMTELSCNTDCSWRRSTYFSKKPGEKLKMGPVWDFDLAFGNFSKDNAGDDTWVSTEPDDDYVGETWSTYLLEDPAFRALFKQRWQEVSAKLIRVAMEEIDEDYKLLSPSAEMNFARWDILGKKVAFERQDTKYYRTYSSQIYYLKNFIKTRAAWIDSQVEAW